MVADYEYRHGAVVVDTGQACEGDATAFDLGRDDQHLNVVFEQVHMLADQSGTVG